MTDSSPDTHALSPSVEPAGPPDLLVLPNPGQGDPQVQSMAEMLSLPPALLPVAQVLADSLRTQFLKVLPYVHSPRVSFTLAREPAWAEVLAAGPAAPLLVTLSLVRAFRQAGARATFTGKDVLSVPMGALGNPVMMSVTGAKIDGWVFLQMSREEQEQHFPDEEDLSRALSLSQEDARPPETVEGAAPNEWTLIFYLGD